MLIVPLLEWFPLKKNVVGSKKIKHLKSEQVTHPREAFVLTKLAQLL